MAFYIDKYGDITINEYGLYRLATYIAGPVPIDKPNRITLDSWYPRPPWLIGFIICSYTSIAFS